MKISIITATLNNAATIRDTLESVLIQTYQDWELILQDGLSTDATLSIAREYEAKSDGRIRIFSERDKGLYDALNRGISRSTGEVIGILAADDFFTSDGILSIINNQLSDKSIDAIYGDVFYVERINKRRKVRHYSSKIFRPALMRLGFRPSTPLRQGLRAFAQWYAKYYDTKQ